MHRGAENANAAVWMRTTDRSLYVNPKNCELWSSSITPLTLSSVLMVNRDVDHLRMSVCRGMVSRVVHNYGNW
jgi:hypothetical protein